MAKAKTVYICQNCGISSPKWVGRCPSCGAWNTFVEEVVSKSPGRTLDSLRDRPRIERLAEVDHTREPRLDTGIQELNRILGGGMVPGSVLLLGGEPGIGKSTLALQLAMGLDNSSSLYVSGEESSRQIRMRAERLGKIAESNYILTETLLEQILNTVEQVKPGLLIVDSIQTVHTDEIESPAGSVTQIRESTSRILKMAKQSALPVIIIGHINKDGQLAGPKVLEHIVDTVLQFEGDRNHNYRILRSMKNRFGSTSELGIFEMDSGGLKEVPNPSEILLSDHQENISGIAIASTIDGIRPFLIEVQSLVSSAVYGTPQRSATGFDIRRLNMLLAVLEKRAGFRLAAKDVFLNIAGGIRVDDPAIDLAVVATILSSSIDIPIPKQTVFAAEVGLTGEIRPVQRIDTRVKEAEKLGFESVFVSGYSKRALKELDNKNRIEYVYKVEDLVKKLFTGKKK